MGETDQTWMLSAAGNALHRMRTLIDVPVAVCDGMLVLSQRRTDDHASLIANDRHPRCKRCAKETS